MASNSFGINFTYTTWGESHGPSIGAVIDGCPAGIEISSDDIQAELNLRKPGASPLTSPRNEQDICSIESGVFNGKSTGAPICLQIVNRSYDSTPYSSMKSVHKPGHASFTYKQKYKTFDYNGSGRASARETAARVAVYGVAKKILEKHGVKVFAYVHSIGGAASSLNHIPYSDALRKARNTSSIFAVDPQAAEEMKKTLCDARDAGDSLGATVYFTTTNLPIGLGEPIYYKVNAHVGGALFSIPATKSVLFGAENVAAMKGSQYNDTMDSNAPNYFLTNNCGGSLGGISNGMPLYGSVTFKPTSSIKRAQQSMTHTLHNAQYSTPKEGKHDPCVGVRGCIVVEAMAGIALCDLLITSMIRK